MANDTFRKGGFMNWQNNNIIKKIKEKSKNKNKGKFKNYIAEARF